jgi:hypothetical protein
MTIAVIRYAAKNILSSFFPKNSNSNRVDLAYKELVGRRGIFDAFCYVIADNNLTGSTVYLLHLEDRKNGNRFQSTRFSE